MLTDATFDPSPTASNRQISPSGPSHDPPARKSGLLICRTKLRNRQSELSARGGHFERSHRGFQVTDDPSCPTISISDPFAGPFSATIDPSAFPTTLPLCQTLLQRVILGSNRWEAALGRWACCPGFSEKAGHTRSCRHRCCHPERSEGSLSSEPERSFASLRMTMSRSPLTAYLSPLTSHLSPLVYREVWVMPVSTRWPVSPWMLLAFTKPTGGQNHLASLIPGSSRVNSTVLRQWWNEP